VLCTLFFILFLFLENCAPRFENNKIISYFREKLFIVLYWMIFTRGNAPICPHFHDSYTNSSRCVSVFKRLSRRRWIASIPTYWSLLFSFFIESIKLKSPLFILLEHRYACIQKRSCPYDVAAFRTSEISQEIANRYFLLIRQLILMYF